jgi:hypothetical protein
VTSALKTRAEVEKLARLLHRDPADLAFLEDAAPADVRALREQVTDTLFDDDAAVLERAAAASRRLPNPVVATIAQRAFGPLLSARIASRLEPQRAVELAGRLPDEFLADVAVELDPRRVSAIVAGIPREQIVRIGLVLARRGEHVAMGRFVGLLPQRSVTAVVDALSDADLLRIAFVSEDQEHIEAVIADLPDHRLAGMLGAADADGLWPEALSLAAELGNDRIARLAALAAAQDDRVLDSLLAVAQDDGLWPAVLPLVRGLDDDARLRFARRPAFKRKTVLRAAVAAAAECGLWAELLPIVPALTAPARREVATAVAALDHATLAGALAEAERAGLRDVVDTLVAELEPAQREALAPVLRGG